MAAKNDGQVDLERDPTPEGEASTTFESPEERAEQARHKRSMEKLAAEQGPIGKLIGSDDSSLTVSFIILMVGFIALGVVGIASIWADGLGTALERLLTFQLTVAGYIFGKKSS